MNSVEFGDAVYMDFSQRNISGEIPNEVNGFVLGLFTNGYHKTYVGESSIVHDVPANRYTGDRIKSVDELLKEPTTVGFAVLDGTILKHLKDSGSFVMSGKKPIQFYRDNRVYYVF